MEPILDEPTVAELLASATSDLAGAGIEEARTEAVLLMAEALGVSRARVMAYPETELHPESLRKFRAMVARRAAREPFAYVVRHREFYGLDLEVTPAVLVPRPETELLVETALHASARLKARKEGGLKAADLGTGSGAIAVALAVNAPYLRVIALDASPEALAVARRNAERHGVHERVEFRQSDLLSAVTEEIDILIANLPYVPSVALDELMPEVRNHEPRSALDGGPDGTALIRRALAEAADLMAPAGLLLFEIGEGQGESLLTQARGLYPGARVRVDRDYAGLERMLSIELA